MNYEIVKTPQGLSLKTDLGILHLDFIKDKVNYLRPLKKGKNELIAKAIGISKGVKTVIDATAGLGQDAIVLARLGLNVIAIERSPLIFQLLQDAKFRALTESPELSWLQHLDFIEGDSLKILKKLSHIEKPDAIYLDPMFPEKKKDALPRKEMQIFRSLVGEDEDSVELLRLALTVAKLRVVVKRPLRAPDLLAGVTHRFEGSNVRYDLYSPT